MSKKELFDTEIEPLINQLYDTCEKHGISYSALFQLDVHKDESGDQVGVDFVQSQFGAEGELISPKLHAIHCICAGSMEFAEAVTAAGRMIDLDGDANHD